MRRSDLHFSGSTLVTVWRINCKGRSREISQGTAAIIKVRDDGGAEGTNSNGGLRGGLQVESQEGCVGRLEVGCKERKAGVG